MDYTMVDDQREALPLTDVAVLIADLLEPEEGTSLEAARRLRRDLSALQVFDHVPDGGLLLDSATCTALHTLYTAGGAHAPVD